MHTEGELRLQYMARMDELDDDKLERWCIDELVRWRMRAELGKGELSKLDAWLRQHLPNLERPTGATPVDVAIGALQVAAQGIPAIARAMTTVMRPYMAEDTLDLGEGPFNIKEARHGVRRDSPSHRD
jgi:hypothetical protein